MVLILTLVFAGVLILLAASMSASTRSRLGSSRDEAQALRAEMASEAGLEYAQRQLSLDPDWPGTAGQEVQMGSGGSFEVAVKGREHLLDGGTNVNLSVAGRHGEALHRFSSLVRVTPHQMTPYSYALMVLGENFSMSHGLVHGDVLFADRAHKVNDWTFDAGGVGYYAEGSGPAEDGKKEFIGTVVDGSVFKYRDDLPNYQPLAPEIVIQENTWAPAWDLDEFLAPGPGKVILTNPHNIGNQQWNLVNLTYEETVVIRLTNQQTVTLTNCNFLGGLVIDCPKNYDLRAGGRNLVHVKKNNVIGGGAGGVEPNIGLVAPGGTLLTDNDTVSVSGFTLVNDVKFMRNASIRGQMVILNDAFDITDSTITRDPALAAGTPHWFTFGLPYATTALLALYEDFN